MESFDIYWGFIGIVLGAIGMIYFLDFLLSKIGLNLDVKVLIDYIAGFLTLPFK